MHMVMQNHDAVHHKPAINYKSFVLYLPATGVMLHACQCATGYLFSL